MDWIKATIKSHIVKILILFVTITIFIYPSFYGKASTSTEVYFSSQVDCSQKLRESIEEADHSIVFALYMFTDESLCNALLEAVERGVKVEGVLDGVILKKRKNIFDKLSAGGVDIKIVKKDRGILHHKFIVIDEKKVITGSYNWTFYAKTFNYENIVIIKNRKIANEYIKEYKRSLWDIYATMTIKNYSTDDIKYFTNIA